MFGTKTLAEYCADLKRMLNELPGGPDEWFTKEIETAKSNSARNVEALLMLRALSDSRGRVTKRRSDQR